MSKIEANTIDSVSGTSTLTLGSSNASTITKASGVNANFAGLSVADEWYVSSSFTVSASTMSVVSSNWTRNDNGNIGTNMSQSSGVFTFPSTGIYLITYQHSMYKDGDSRHSEIQIQTSSDSGSSFSTIGSADAFVQQTSGNNTHASWSVSLMHDVANASTHRARFRVQHTGSSVTNYAGKGRIQATFIRLGDT